MQAWRQLALLVCAGVSVVIPAATGCGSERVPGDSATSLTMTSAVSPSSSISTTTVTATQTSLSSTPASVVESRSDVAELFGELARTMAPLPVYGLEELPLEVSLPTKWWPVLSVDLPSDYDGPDVANPWVSDSPPGTQEAQVLLETSDGWLVILENFRGDLGDVTGSAVGTVAGRPAVLYELGGGVLVQWSDRGAWYGVFGRGVGADEVVRTALVLKPIDPAY